MILLEPGLSRNDELQAIGRIRREKQTKECYVYRLYMVNSMDKYREWKSTEKFVPEVAVYSDGEDCQKHVEKLMKSLPSGCCGHLTNGVEGVEGGRNRKQ